MSCKGLLTLIVALTVLTACETKRETIYQIPFEGDMRDVFISYPAGKTKEQAIADGSAVYAAISSKKPAYCNGTRADCLKQLISMEDRISGLGDKG